MTIRVFTLCDGAYNYNGKLTIVGTVDSIKVQKVPEKASIGLAVKIDFLPHEKGEKNVFIHFKNNQGNLIMPEMKFVTKPDEKKEAMSLVIAGNINGLDITELGDYTVELQVNNDTFTLPFKVIK